MPVLTLANRYLPSLTLVRSHLPLLTLVHPHSPSLTLIHPHSPSLALAYPHSPSSALTHSRSLSSTLAHARPPSLSLVRPPLPTLTDVHPPSPTLVHPLAVRSALCFVYKALSSLYVRSTFSPGGTRPSLSPPTLPRIRLGHAHSSAASVGLPGFGNRTTFRRRRRFYLGKEFLESSP